MKAAIRDRFFIIVQGGSFISALDATRARFNELVQAYFVGVL